MYRELVNMNKEGLVDFSHCTFFNLDEYFGLRKDALQSYNRFMVENFFEYVGASEEQYHIPDGSIANSEIASFCDEYEAKIRSAGGIDIQIVGMGRNGHIGFNEPGSSFDSRTRLVTLADSTRRDAAQEFFGITNVPTQAITMGIATILEAREIVMLVLGEHKANSLKSAVEGMPTPEIPASFLVSWLGHHGLVEILADRSAASKLVSYSAPWLVREVNWRKEDVVAKQALIWLALRKGKSIGELSVEDFRSEHLTSLLESVGTDFPLQVLEEFRSKPSVTEILPDNTTSVLIFSPHPDDDVICMGSSMKKLRDSGIELHVGYMVSGSNAVRDLEVLNFLVLHDPDILKIVETSGGKSRISPDGAVARVKKAIYSKSKGAPDDPLVRQIKAEIRRKEAIRASHKTGAHPHFLNLPFYEEYGTARKAPLSEKDTDIVRDFMLSLMPDVIFIAGDSTDPNGTHSMCLDAIESALDAVSKRYSPRLMLQYRGAWEEFTLDEADSIEPLTGEELNGKIEMILEHVSQLNPLFPGPDDDREFWERARDRNLLFLKTCRDLGLHFDQEFVGAEIYKRFELG
jgi:glucosamine-6-phosphate deaminase